MLVLKAKTGHPGRRLSFAGGQLLRWNAVGDALALTTAADADHLAAAVGFDAAEWPRDLVHLGRVEHRHFVTKTAIAVELP